MPLDVLGRTRATLTTPASATLLGLRVRAIWASRRRAGDRPLQFWASNEEFLVSAGHQPALITSLPFVHTARRYYRSNGSARTPVLKFDCDGLEDWWLCDLAESKRVERHVRYATCRQMVLTHGYDIL